MAAAVAFGGALALSLLWFALSRQPEDLPKNYPTHGLAAEKVAESMAAWLGKNRKGRVNITLLEKDQFDNELFPAWQPEEISGRLYLALSKAGLEHKVSFAADRDAAIKNVVFLRRYDSALFSGSVMEKFGQGKTPDLRMDCKVARVAESSGTMKLACAFHDLTTHEEHPFEAVFVHPDYADHVKARLERYGRWRRSIGLLAQASASAAGVSLLLALSTGWLYRRRCGEARDELPLRLESINGLLRNHSYNQAGKEIARGLEYLPDDPTLGALRDRLQVALEDYGGDALKAESARIKIERFRKEAQEGSQPSEASIRDLEALPGVEARELAKAFQARIDSVKQLEFEKARERENQAELARRAGRVRSLIGQGRLEEARSQAEEALKTFPGEEAAALLGEVESRIGEAGKTWQDALGFLSKADAASARGAALECSKQDAGNKDAGRLLSLWREASDKALPRILRPCKVGKPIWLLHQESFVIGRSRSMGAVVEVPDERVSRAHLKLCVLGEKLLAEDLESRGGSYLAGDKFTRSEARDGDILNLAHAVDCEVHVFRDGGAAASVAETRLAGGDPRMRRFPSSGPVLGVWLEFPNFSVLWGRMPVKFSDAGMYADRGSGIDLCYKNGILLWGRPGGYKPVFLAETVEHRGVGYVFEQS
jgi:hypothetical protein